ncbi:hypothetical protein DM46_2700 [Burkholderia mallei]|nr:hypothetical protein DM46_2700 [Burkholderia mallei]
MSGRALSGRTLTGRTQNKSRHRAGFRKGPSKKIRIPIIVRPSPFARSSAHATGRSRG